MVGDTSASVVIGAEAYNSAHVASASVITASGLSLVSIVGNLNSYTSDYTLAANALTVAGSITPYTITPTLSAANTSKTYDGTTSVGSGFAATLTAAGVGGDTFTLSDGSESYNSAHVVSASSITSSGISLSAVGGTLNSATSDYALGSTSAAVSAAITPYTITPTLSAANTSKTYDGTTSVGSGFTATLTAAGVGGDTFTLSDGSESYNSAHVVSASSITSSGISLSAVAGTLNSATSDYALASTSAAVAGTINPVTLTPTLTATGTSKVYDGTTLVSSSFAPTIALSGFVVGDTSASVVIGAEAYNSAHVVSASLISVSSLSISGVTGGLNSSSSDYVLASTLLTTSGQILPLTVSPSVSATGTVKAYDGNASVGSAFAATITASGLVGDGLVLASSSQAYNSAEVASATNISIAGLVINHVSGVNASLPSDYALSANAVTVPGTITLASSGPVVLPVLLPPATVPIANASVTTSVTNVLGNTRTSPTGDNGSTNASSSNNPLVSDSVASVAASSLSNSAAPAVANTVTTTADLSAGIASNSTVITNPSSAMSASSSSSSTSSNGASSNTAVVPVGNQSPGVVVRVISAPTQQNLGLVTVTLPSGYSTSGVGLVVDLPAELVQVSQQTQNKIQVLTTQNGPLPSWLKFDAEKNTLIAGAVPDGAFPYKVNVWIGQTRTIVEIAEEKSTLSGANQ